MRFATGGSTRKTPNDATCARRRLRGEQMTACEQIRVCTVVVFRSSTTNEHQMNFLPVMRDSSPHWKPMSCVNDCTPPSQSFYFVTHTAALFLVSLIDYDWRLRLPHVWSTHQGISFGQKIVHVHRSEKHLMEQVVYCYSK